MLNGRTVLIVEAEFLIAFDIQRMLEAQLTGSMLFARSPVEASEHQALWPTIDLAIVDVGLDAEGILPLLLGLRQAGVALILSTTESKMRQGHPQFPGAPVLIKPMIEDDFHRAVSAALGGAIRRSGYES